MAEGKDQQVSQAIIKDQKLTSSEGAQDFRPTERRVMTRDTSNLDQSQIRSTKLENGRVVYRIGGVEVSKEEFFKK